MSAPKERPRGLYFFDPMRAKELNRAVCVVLDRAQKETVQRYISLENAHHLRHGRNWSHPGLQDVEDTEMREHSFETTSKFDAIVNHDLSELGRVVGELVRAMEEQFVKLMLTTASEACEKAGNVFDAKAAGSQREAFAQMLEKIEFKADKDGVVHLPQIHTSPAAYRKFAAELSDSPPEFVARVEAIKARKTAEAQDRERARKERFLNYGGEL